MNVDFLRAWLVNKYEELETRTIKALTQLNEEQLNWKPNENSNSVANLIVHIRGNIQERVSFGIFNKELVRDRDAEFKTMQVPKEELISLVRELYAELIGSIKAMESAQFSEIQRVRGRERTNSDVLLQVATHLSEHTGQMLFIAKLCLDEAYSSTTIPKRK